MQVLTPSKRRMPLAQIPNFKFSLALNDFLAAYQKIFAHKITEDFPNYIIKKTTLEKINYLKSHVLPSIKDNKKKGDLGEELYRIHIKKTKPSYD